MKTTEKKLEYVRLRAEGHSYRVIASELNISKSTCSNWEKELRLDIEACKGEKLRELYTSYRLTKEDRVEELGKTLQGIREALEGKSLSDLPIDKLLELKLKYERELRAEYSEPLEDAEEDTLEGLLEQYNKLYIASQSGRYSPAQIKAQLAILDAKKTTINALEADKLVLIP